MHIFSKLCGGFVKGIHKYEGMYASLCLMVPIADLSKSTNLFREVTCCRLQTYSITVSHFSCYHYYA